MNENELTTTTCVGRKSVRCTEDGCVYGKVTVPIPCEHERTEPHNWCPEHGITKNLEHDGEESN